MKIEDQSDSSSIKALIRSIEGIKKSCELRSFLDKNALYLNKKELEIQKSQDPFFTLSYQCFSVYSDSHCEYNLEVQALDCPMTSADNSVTTPAMVKVKVHTFKP